MVPNVADTGTSFVGAGRYYLHDKRQEGESSRLSTERVAWTETRNLLTDDPELALRIMAGTAMNQDQLKEAAGVRKTGRKSDQSVYAYSIAWHPDEAGRIDRAEMLKAADQSLKALGAHDRQAVIVAHADEPHPHVHVIVNRVSPEDGRMLSKSNDWKKLEAWALSYRRERGEEQLYCPLRVKKAEAIEQQRQGIKVPFVRATKEASKRSPANDNDATRMRKEQHQKDAQLSSFGRTQQQRHKNEWTLLSQRYQARKAEIGGRLRGRGSASPLSKARADVKEQFRPAWRELSRRQYFELRNFDQREKRLTGKIENAIAAVRLSKELEREDSRGFVAAAFNFLTSKKARRAALMKRHNREKRELGGMERQHGDRAVQTLKDDQAMAFNSARQSFNRDRQVLIDQQAAEKAALQRQWANRKVERNRVSAILQTKATYRDEAEARARPAERTTSKGQKRAEYNGAKDGKWPTRNRKRSRVRKRTRDDD